VLHHFTPAAQTAIALAQDEARALGHREVGVEHLLLGLLREETGLGGRLLEELGLTVDGARAEVARLSPKGEGRVPDQLDFTPGARAALEHALRNALAHEQQIIGPEHILLGVLDAGNKVAVGVLRACGGDPDALRESLLEWLRGEPPEAASGAARAVVHLASPAARLWEYRLRSFDPLDGTAAEELNRLGAEGWELVAAVGEAPWLVFKRPAG
jgi:ATP-dependent Clp protease ATP-binding subunit ClpC